MLPNANSPLQAASTQPSTYQAAVTSDSTNGFAARFALTVHPRPDSSDPSSFTVRVEEQLSALPVSKSQMDQWHQWSAAKAEKLTGEEASDGGAAAEGPASPDPSPSQEARPGGLLLAKVASLLRAGTAGMVENPDPSGGNGKQSSPCEVFLAQVGAFCTCPLTPGHASRLVA